MDTGKFSLLWDCKGGRCRCNRLTLKQKPGDDVVRDEEAVLGDADVPGRGELGRDEAEGALGEERVGDGGRGDAAKDVIREAGGGAEAEHDGLLGRLAGREGLTLRPPAEEAAGGVTPRQFLGIPGADAGGGRSFAALRMTGGGMLKL